jgi:hypothetical protein
MDEASARRERPVRAPSIASRTWWLGAAAAALVGACAGPAAAAFHQMMIVQVVGGSAVAPDAQYVVLQMWNSGQSQVQGHSVTFYDEQGSNPVSATFSDNLQNSADNATMLLATATAEALYGLTADLRIAPVLLPGGGKVCFESWDCFAWGSYGGSATGVGTPYATGSGLLPDEAATRRLDVCSSVGCSDAVLDPGDDTNDCANDFVPGVPAPQNNSGALGAENPDALFLDGFERGATSGWSQAVS